MGAETDARALPSAEVCGDDTFGDGDGESDDEDDEDDEDGWVNCDEEWTPRLTESLFDGHVSASFEANAAYMRRTHGFVVPTSGLHDAAGLFGMLQAKLWRAHACVCCHRRFGSVEAVRAHMLAKGHCRLDLERADERTLVEVAPFYDVDSALPWLRRRVGYLDANGEIVLPSGRTLGHRALRSAYRQRYQKEDTRVSVVAARRSYEARVRTRLGLRPGQPLPPNASRVLAASHADLAAQVAQRAARQAEHRLLLGSFARAGGTSKALASSYVHKADFADNKHARAITHHGYGGFGGGAHYTMAGSRQFQRGVRVKGVVSRHSVQGARLGASRQAVRQAGGSGKVSSKKGS